MAGRYVYYDGMKKRTFSSSLQRDEMCTFTLNTGMRLFMGEDDEDGGDSSIAVGEPTYLIGSFGGFRMKKSQARVIDGQ